LAAALVAAIVAVLVGCGGSSKPSYCSDLSNLKSSVNDLKNVSITDLSSVKSAIQKVESDGKAVVSSAKDDFPSETSALSTSLSALETTLGQLNSSTATAALKQLPAQVSATVTAVDNFSSATKSKCD
jgi:hypothetical protein